MKLSISVYVLIALFTTFDVFAQPSSSNSVTLIVKDSNDKPIRGRSVMVSFKGESGKEEQKVGATDNDGKAVIKVDGIKSLQKYYVSVRDMDVKNPFQFADGKPTIVIVRSIPNNDNIVIGLKKDNKNKADEIAFLKRKLIDDNTLSEREKNELRMALETLKQEYDLIQMKLDDGKVAINDIQSEFRVLQQRFSYIQGLLLIATMEASEISCQKFIEKESMTIRFKLAYPDYIATAIDSVKKEQVLLELAVSRSEKRELPNPVTSREGKPYVPILTYYPTGDFIDVTFFVAERERKAFTKDKQYSISISNVTDRNKPISPIFNIRETESCYPTSTKPGESGIIAFAEVSCQEMKVELWDGNVDGDRVSLLNKTTGEQIVYDFLLPEKKAAQEFPCPLRQGANQIELIGVDPGTEQYEVSAKARFFCKNNSKPVVFRNIEGKEIGDILTLNNSVSRRGRELVNEIKKSVIITYKP